MLVSEALGGKSHACNVARTRKQQMTSLKAGVKKKQITFRVDRTAFAETLAAVEKEDLKLADFARKLHQIALTLYNQAGSLAELRALAARKR